MESMNQTVPGVFRKGLAWVWERRILLLFLVLMAAMLPARSLWAPDEPDFAQCAREMRERGSWLLPYLNGQPYAEKPILFFWLIKSFAMVGEWLWRGRGFVHGLAPWALRLPSVLSASLFALGFRRWIKRFQGKAPTAMSCVVLFTTPIWVWQAQTIQVDMVFATLLAWSWLAWLGGYLLASGPEPLALPGEGSRWFAEAYLALGLAILAKGPLALVLTVLLGMAFLTWQRDWRGLARCRPWFGAAIVGLIVLPWYVAAIIKGGPAYAYQMVIHQNFDRATNAWDHVQPWWRYFTYLAGDFWPWVLLIPALVLHLVRNRKTLTPILRFQLLAFLVPMVFLSMVHSKQGKYLLMAYPFLALMIPFGVPRNLEGRRSWGWPAWALASGLGLSAMALMAVAFTHAGGPKLHRQLLPFLNPVRGLALILLAGAAAAIWRARQGRPWPLVREVGSTLGLVYLTVALWGFPLLEGTKGYQGWTATVTPLIQGRRVFFWQTLRSGAMVYTDHLMPEVRSLQELDALMGPEDRLVSQEREWKMDAWGMDPLARDRFEVLVRVPVGENALLLIRKKLTPPGGGA